MTVHWTSGQVTLLHGDVLAVLREMPAESVHCVVTSPPYWGLRDYGIEGQIGLEESPEAYVSRMVEVFREVRRVLRADGTCWLNLGDSYAGPNGFRPEHQATSTLGPKKDGLKPSNAAFISKPSGQPVPRGLKPKDLIGIPWRVALALQADGWWLRSEITWCKRAPMPESVTDRPTSATEKVFLLAKSERYFYDADAVREPNTPGTVERLQSGPVQAKADGPKNALCRQDGGTEPYAAAAGRNQRNWWLLGPEPYPSAHFATFPSEIPRRAILAGTSERGCCAACGAPWARQTEVRGARNQSWHNHENDLQRGQRGQPCPDDYERVTTGWRPTCACHAMRVPCVVLDPFIGSGTTCMVATQLGRHSIGIDLKAEYLELAVKRNQQMGLELPA